MGRDLEQKDWGLATWIESSPITSLDDLPDELRSIGELLMREAPGVEILLHCRNRERLQDIVNPKLWGKDIPHSPERPQRCILEVRLGDNQLLVDRAA